MSSAATSCTNEGSDCCAASVPRAWRPCSTVRVHLPLDDEVGPLDGVMHSSVIRQHRSTGSHAAEPHPSCEQGEELSTSCPSLVCKPASHSWQRLD